MEIVNHVMKLMKSNVIVDHKKILLIVPNLLILVVKYVVEYLIVVNINV